MGQCGGSPRVHAFSARSRLGYWSDSLAAIGSCKEGVGKGRRTYCRVRGGCPNTLPRQSNCSQFPPWCIIVHLWIRRLPICEYGYRRRYRIWLNAFVAVLRGFIHIWIQICVVNVDKDGLGLFLCRSPMYNWDLGWLLTPILCPDWKVGMAPPRTRRIRRSSLLPHPVIPVQERPLRERNVGRCLGSPWECCSHSDLGRSSCKTLGVFRYRSDHCGSCSS